MLHVWFCPFEHHNFENNKKGSVPQLEHIKVYLKRWTPDFYKDNKKISWKLLITCYSMRGIIYFIIQLRLQVCDKL